MEKKQFTPHGGMAVCNNGGIEIELSPNGEKARFRLFEDTITRWHIIRHNAKGEAYCTTRMGRMYLHDFMRY